MDYEVIKTPIELFEFVINNIDFGFLKYGEKVKLDLTSKLLFINQLLKYYQLQSPNELLMSKCGISFDHSELMVSWLREYKYNFSTYYVPARQHSMLVYEDNNKYNWIETCSKKLIGIHEFDNLEDVFYFFLSSYDMDINSFSIYEYKYLRYGSGFADVICQAKNGRVLLKKWT